MITCSVLKLLLARSHRLHVDIVVRFPGNWMDLDETWPRNGVGKEWHWKIFGDIAPGAPEKGAETKIDFRDKYHIVVWSLLLYYGRPCAMLDASHSVLPL